MASGDGDVTMSDFDTYRAVNSLSIPIFEQDGTARKDGRERLVQGGQNVDLPADLAKRAIESGSVRELTEQERAELEPAGEPEEGSEVNGSPTTGPGAEVVAPSADGDTETDENGKLKRPSNGASKDKWVRYAEQEGLDPSGTRDEIRSRVEAAEMLESK